MTVTRFGRANFGQVSALGHRHSFGSEQTISQGKRNMVGGIANGEIAFRLLKNEALTSPRVGSSPSPAEEAL